MLPADKYSRQSLYWAVPDTAPARLNHSSAGSQTNAAELHDRAAWLNQAKTRLVEFPNWQPDPESRSVSISLTNITGAAVKAELDPLIYTHHVSVNDVAEPTNSPDTSVQIVVPTPTLDRNDLYGLNRVATILEERFGIPRQPTSANRTLTVRDLFHRALRALTRTRPHRAA